MINSLLFYSAIFISIVTESLPISSSSHVYLVCRWLESFFSLSVDAPFLQNIELLTHGCYLIVLTLFFRSSWRVYLKTFPDSWHLLWHVIMQGFIIESISVFFYVLFYKQYQSSLHIACGLIITAAFLYSLRYITSDQKYISWHIKQSIFLGCAQGIAFFPGISRFASTFVCARWLHMSARRSFEISFLIALPINGAAFLLGLIRMHKYAYHYSYQLAMAMAMASFFMYLGLMIVKSLIRRGKLWYFSIYVVFLACMILLQSLRYILI